MNEFVSVSQNHSQRYDKRPLFVYVRRICCSARSVHIACDGGRVCRREETHFLTSTKGGCYLFCRPYIIVSNGEPKVRDQHIEELVQGVRYILYV